MMGSRKKDFSFKRKLIEVAVISCFAGNTAHAAPTGAAVKHGSATIATSGSTMTITNTPNAIINWASFGIDANETVRFVQQSSASSVLNRVTGADPSRILGALQSNGKVFLVNPNGIIFGQGARIDVNGLVASTLNMTDADFLDGRLRFNADRLSPGAVSNAGEIRTPTGGFVYLLAPNVENSGIITTPSGEAILAAGNSVEVVDSTNPLQRVLVSAKSQDVNLSQLMTESGGNIFSLLNKGKVSANTVVQDQTGKIYFKSAGSIQTEAISVVEAHGDSAANGGLIQAFADLHGVYAGSFDVSGRNGGFIETSGHWLDINGSSINAHALDASGNPGTWLLDPYNYTISASEASLISSALNGGANVVIDTSANVPSYGSSGNSTDAGNITFNSPITVASPTVSTPTLTLLADGSITFNAPISNSSGFLAFGNNVTLNINMLADRDSNGNGGIFVNDMIEARGAVSILNNSNKIVLDASTAGRTVGLLAEGTLDIRSDGGLQLKGGSGTNQRALIASGGNMTISAGDIELVGGNGSGGDNLALIHSLSNMQIVAYGDIALTGGFGGDNNNAEIVSYGTQHIYFTNSGNSLTLQGGTSGNNNHAQILAYGGAQIIQGNDCSDGCLGYEAGYNPNIVLDAGSGSSSAASDNGAYINLTSGGSVQAINAANIAMYGGSDGFSNAAISHFYGASSTFIIEKYAIPGSPGTLTYGKLYMEGDINSGTIAAIGSERSNADITIEAGEVVIKNSVVGAMGYNNGLPSGTPNDATVHINAYGGGSLLIQGSQIGSEFGTLFGSLASYGGNISIIDSMIGAETGGGDTFLNIMTSQGDVVLNNANIGADGGFASIYIGTGNGGDILSSNGSVVGSFSGTGSVTLEAYGGNISLDSTGMGSSSGFADVRIHAYGGNVTLDNAKLGTETGGAAAYYGSVVRVSAGLAYGSAPFTLGQSISWSGTTGGIRARNVTLDATGTIGASSAPLLLDAAILNVNTHGSLAANNTNDNGVYLANAGLLDSALINAGNIELKQLGGFATNGGLVAHANSLQIAGGPSMILDGFSVSFDSVNTSLSSQNAALSVTSTGTLTMINGASLVSSGSGNVLVNVAATGAVSLTGSDIIASTAGGTATTQINAASLGLSASSGLGAYGSIAAQTLVNTTGNQLLDQSHIYASTASGSADLDIGGADITLVNSSGITANGGTSFSDLSVSATNLTVNSNSLIESTGASSSTLTLSATNAMNLTNSTLNLNASGAFATLALNAQSMGLNTAALTTNGVTNAQTALNASGGLAVGGTSTITANASSGNAQVLLGGNALTLVNSTITAVGPGGTTIDLDSGGNSSLNGVTFNANSASGFSGFAFSGSGSTGMNATTLSLTGTGGASANFSSGGDTSVSASSFNINGGNVSGGFFLDSDGSLSVLNTTISASSSGDADADLSAGTNLILDNIGIGVFGASGYGEAALTGGTITMINNSSLSVSGGLVAYALVDASGALTMNNSDVVANDIEFYGGSVLLQNGSFMNAVIMDGHSKTDIKLDASHLFAQDEMILEVGGQIFLDNFSDITVVSPFTLFFDFPLLSSGGWVVDGIPGSFGSSSGSYIEVAGAAPILGVNFFVTYGGTAITNPVVNLTTNQLLTSSQPSAIIVSNTLATAPTSSDFFGTGDTSGSSSGITDTGSMEENTAGEPGEGEAESAASEGGEIFELGSPEGEPEDQPQQCS